VALERLKEEAANMGADAVVMMRFDSGSIGTDMQSVVAYGTAVKLIEIYRTLNCNEIRASIC